MWVSPRRNASAIPGRSSSKGDTVARMYSSPFERAFLRGRGPQMALRPDYYHPDEMDDIVVKDVEMFRAEAMSENNWWMACYFANGERITFDVHREKKPARVSVTVVEMPDDWTDLDAHKPRR